MTNSIPPLFSHEDYRKSSFSTGDDPQCVEIAHRDGWVGFRDSKTTQGSDYDTRLAVPTTNFADFVTSIRLGIIG